MAKVDVEMPKMGESITEGTVIVWHKQPGDEVEQDETLLEIGTDKVDTEVPSPEAGVLSEILVNEGDTVEVGTIIARLDTEVPSPEAGDTAEPSGTPTAETDAEPDAPAEDPAADAAPATDDVPAEQEEPQEQKEQEAPAPAAEDHEVVMPKMGESITEGTIIAWHKDTGDEIALDETILEIGTDKVDTEVPSPAAGVLKARLVEEGETVEVGTPIAVIGAEVGAAPQPTDGGQATETSQATEPSTPEPSRTPTSGDGAVSSGAPSGDGEPIQRRGPDGSFYSPLVRSIAEEEGITMRELQSIDGSGREGRVTKQDVLDYLETREAQPAGGSQTAAPATAPSRPPRPGRPVPGGDGYTVEEGPSADELRQRYDERVEIVEMDRMRKITAEHMVRSKATSAHVTSFAEADVTGLVQFRNKHKQAFQEREGIKLTFTPFFVKAAVEALREHPVLNASVEGDKIVMKKDYHVGIAVAIGQ